MFNNEENKYTLIMDLSSEILEIPDASILSKTILNKRNLKVVFFGFAHKQELSEHTASMPAILHIIEGQADITLGDEKIRAGTGAWIYMPPNLSHSIYAKTALKMLLYLLKSQPQGE